MTLIPTQVNYQIPELFKEAFGIYGRFPIYFLGKAKPGTPPDPVDMKISDWNIPPSGLTDDKGVYITPSGVPIWDRIGFTEVPFLTDGENPVFWMPHVVTAEVSDDKNMVLTELIGAKGGTVKELMSDGDKVITFRGLIINWENPDEFPEEQVKRLNDLYDLKQSIKVVSKWLNDANDIYQLVFTRRVIKGMEGVANVAQFEFTALSDNDIVLELSN